MVIGDGVVVRGAGSYIYGNDVSVAGDRHSVCGTVRSVVGTRLVLCGPEQLRAHAQPPHITVRVDADYASQFRDAAMLFEHTREWRAAEIARGVNIP